MQKEPESPQQTSTVDASNLLNTNVESGLTTQEAELRLKKYGPNNLPEPKPKHWFLIFLAQFKDIMIIILMAATVASFVVAILSGIESDWDFSNQELVVEFVQPFVIIIVVITNSLLGTYQEIQSQKAVRSLRDMSTLNCKVIRDSKLVEIKTTDVVVGDVIVFESGDQIPADANLVTVNNLKVVEAALTGESLPVMKDEKAVVADNAPLGDQLNKVFAGSAVVNGSGKAIVNATGKDSKIGNVAELINDEAILLTPLQLKLSKLSKIFGYSGIGLFILAFFVQVAVSGFGNIESTWTNALLMAISLAVAAIPEGLAAFTTIILSIGIRNMAKENAIIKKLSAVETLGSTGVVCTDKTGTLTQNKITVVDLWTPTDKNANETLKDSHINLIQKAILCTDGSVNIVDNKQEHVGDPTETALIAYGIDKQYLKDELLKQYPRQRVFPFDSQRKLMTVINEIDGQHYAIVKGAPEILLDLCNNVDIKKVDEVIDQYASKAYRTLAVAYKKIEASVVASGKETDFENNLEFLGVVAMIDPPRAETIPAINTCWHAGIKPVMITGDHLNTAIAIAKEVGIMRQGDLAIEGQELAAMSDEQLQKDIAKYAVYARVNPADKLRIVKAWQANDQVVAMTGDGVNDAPALKAADIGCAMGITGTDVSKEAADMILVDDNFNTIVSAVNSGRKIYQTLRRVIQNLLISSIVEIIVVFIGMFTFALIYKEQLGNNPFIALSAIQLLAINLLVHGVPAIALGIQKSENDVMHVRPFSKYESIFARRMGIDLIWQSLLISLLTLVAYALAIEYALANNLAQHLNRFGSTVAFLVIGIAASIHSINLMSDKSIFKCNVKYYKWIYLSATFSVCVIMLITFVPQVAPIFNMTELLWDHPILLAYGFGFALVPTLVIEIYKLVNGFIDKQKNAVAPINDFQMIMRPKQRFKRKSI